MTASALAGAFGRVLAVVAGDAGVRVSALPVVDEAAARELGRPAVLPVAGGPVTVPGLFAERVAAYPDAVALADGPRRLTFAGLDKAAGRVARALRAAETAFES